ncbi:toll/interleukin-1 receptor domain-containing protein [Paraflavisolibacter sp. H34]|uniref:toll/interleukin-1 receptor domain-containing protein n=1 Tax=Huijunlia imazamoxiresistens TaxID=3127457 RepID=UPI00301AFB1B
MRLFVIGSLIRGETNQLEFSEFCQQLGKRLAIKPIELILCSPYPDSADYEVTRGITTIEYKRLSLELHYPKIIETEELWNNIVADLSIKVSKFRHEASEIKEKDSVKYAWLFCQIQAIANSDFVIVIGGKTSGSSNLLVRVAEAQEKEIIPLPKFKGVGGLFFERRRYQLIDSWGSENVEKFYNCDDPEKIIDIIVDGPKDRRAEFPKNKKQYLNFFISYPQERPAEADFVEMILRRRNHNVLRDETSFSAGEEIINSINESIYKSDVFIALYCKEYACSPWCFDELSLAIDPHQKEGKLIWLICMDDTRIVHPKARKILRYKAVTREEIERVILRELEKVY